MAKAAGTKKKVAHRACQMMERVLEAVPERYRPLAAVGIVVLLDLLDETIRSGAG